LYEGELHGASPIALTTVETGRWLARHDAGGLLGEPLGEEPLRYFSGLRPAKYAVATRHVAAMPRTAWIDEGDDGSRLAYSLECRRGQGRSARRHRSVGLHR
jgi:hypothetical protein